MATSSHTAALPPTGPREEGEVPSLAPLRSDQTQEIPRTDIPAAPLVHELTTLISQAPTLFAAEQGEMVGHINARFDEIAARGGSRATADFILGQLDRGGLGDLVDANGRTARAAAVGALLQLGYPYALEVRPEDLEHYRRAQVLDQKVPRGFLPAVMTAGVLTFGIIAAGLSSKVGPLADLGALFGVLAVVTLSVWLAVSRR